LALPQRQDGVAFNIVQSSLNLEKSEEAELAFLAA